MASSVTLESVKKAVFFPMQGKSWGLKVLIGSALAFLGMHIIPIIPLIPLYGYYAQVMKGILVGQEDPQMPDWTDWGAFFRDGIKLFGAAFIYMLPALIMLIGGYALLFGFYFSLIFTVTGFTDTASATLPPAFFISLIGTFAGVAMMMVGFSLTFITIIITPLALGNVIVKGEFMAAFRFREWWPVLKANLSGFILAIVINLGLFYVLYMLVMLLYATIVLSCLLPFALALILFITGVVGNSVYAVAYRDGMQKLAA